MKYIIKHILTLIHYEKMVTLMMILGLMVSSFVILFSYGMIYQLSQKKIDEVNLVNGFEITMHSEKNQYVSWKKLKACLKDLDEGVCNNIAEVRLIAKIDRNEEEYFKYLSFDFLLNRDGTPKYLDMTQIWRDEGLLKSGRYFTKEEFDNKELVAVGFNYEDSEVDGKQSDIARSFVKKGDKTKFIIDGKEYKNIGTAFFWTTPQFPVTALDEKKEIYNIFFEFKNSSVTNFQYENIKKVFNQHFGKLATLPDFNIKEFDSNYYIMIGLLVVFMTLLSVLVLSLLYQYLYIRNEKTYSIYMLCGCKKNSVALYYMGQCLIVAVISFVLMGWIYFKGLLPMLSNSMSYLLESYTPMRVGLLFSVFLAGNLLITAAIAGKLLHRNKFRLT